MKTIIDKIEHKLTTYDRARHVLTHADTIGTMMCWHFVRDDDQSDEQRKFARRMTLESVIRGRAWSVAEGKDPAWSEAMYDIVSMATLEDIPGDTAIEKVKTLSVWLGTTPVEVPRSLFEALMMCGFEEEESGFFPAIVKTKLMDDVMEVLRWQRLNKN